MGVLDLGYVYPIDHYCMIKINVLGFFSNLMMTTLFQGDLGEPGPNGRDGPKVRS